MRAWAAIALGLLASCAASPAIEPLRLVSMTPADGARDVPIDVNPSVTLSESVRLATVADALVLADEAGARVPGTVFAEGAATIVFVPEAPLATSTTYLATMTTTVAGLDGALFPAPFTWRFTTSDKPAATTRPATLALVAVGPMPGATGVETSVRPWVRFDREVRSSSGDGFVLTESSGERVPATEQVAADGRELVLVPERALAAGRTYRLEATSSIAAVDGAHLAATRRWSFTTNEDPNAGQPLTVVSSSLAEGAVRVPVSPRITLTFSRPLAPATVNATTVRLSEPGGVAVVLWVDVLGSELSVAPRDPLQTSRTYELTVSGLMALDGRAMEPASFSLRFFTSSNPLKGVAPRVASVTPSNGASSVAVGTSVVVTFTRPMELASFALARPTLSANGAYVPVTRDLDPSGLQLTIAPVSPLPLDAEVVLTIPTGLRDAEDKLPCPAFSSSFFTGVDRDAPRVLSTSPADGAQNVDPVSMISFSMSEIVASYAVSLSGPAGPVAGTSAIDATGRVVSFAPDAALAMQTTYTATLSSARDLAGNALAAPVSMTFRTSGTADVTPPLFSGLVRATALDETRLQLEWQAASDDRPFRPTYRVYAASGSTVDFAGPFTLVQDATSYVLSNLAPGTTYAVAVRAVDAAGNVDASPIVLSSRTLDVTPPTEVTALSVTPVPGASRLAVSWGAAADQATGAAGLRYRLYVGTSAGGQTFTTSGRAFETNAGETSVELAGPLPGASFLPGRRYYVVVRAVDADGNECPSRTPEASALIPDTTAPSFDGPVTATAISATSIRVTWTQATDDGDTPAELTYRVSKRRADALTFDAPESAFNASLARTISGLAADVAYVFRVEVTDRAGNIATNPNQPSAIGLDLAPPAFPLSNPTLSASSNATGTIDLSWRTASDNRTAAAAMTYRVFASTSLGSLYTAPATTVQGATAARLEGLAAGSWFVAVRAQDEAGNVEANTQTASVVVAP